jgi:hypothetical protein
MRSRIPLLLTIISVLTVVPLTVVAAASQVVNLAPGDTVTVNCATTLSGTVGSTQANLTCGPQATATPTRTSTPVPASGATAGQPCPQALHDSWVATGPDGKSYPTWHPAVDPTYGCFYGHEHGTDPRTSKANSAMPAFGYIGSLAGFNEPHAGFKVFTWYAGESSDMGPVASDMRAVFHMGTSGVARYTERFHSLEFDMVSRDGSGREAHIAGMADTNAAVGTPCDNPQPQNGGRDFSTVGCNNSYEIWSNVHFQIKDPSDPYTDYFHTRITVTAAFASFDPVLTRDPANNARVLYSLNYYQPSSTIDPTSPQSPYLGCRREAYGGPIFFNNSGKATVYYTDAFGNGKPGPGPGIIRQTVSAVNWNANTIQFKIRRDNCLPGVHAPN